MLPMWIPAAIACSAPGTSAGAEERLEDDAVVLARGDRVLELLRLGRRVEVGVEDGQLGVAGRGGGLGGGEHRRVIAVATANDR